MWALFARDFWVKNRVQLSPEGFYHPVNVTGDDNRYNAYEATAGPPRMDFAGGPAQTGYPVPSSPGPATFAIDYPGQFGSGFPPGTSPGLFETGNIIGGGPLYDSPDSNPEQELV